MYPLLEWEMGVCSVDGDGSRKDVLVLSRAQQSCLFGDLSYLHKNF